MFNCELDSNLVEMVIDQFLDKECKARRSFGFYYIYFGKKGKCLMQCNYIAIPFCIQYPLPITQHLKQLNIKYI